jgi:3-oxoacyl-[acyl-carrier-protein] synthase-3
MKAYISAISYYLPENVVSNEELVHDFPEWSVEKIAAKVGISERHVSKENELSSDLAVAAAEKLFMVNDIKKEEIDFLLFCTQSPDYFLPTTACLIQERLGLPISCGALDYNLGCSGFIYGLALAKGLIVAGLAKNVLLITAETYSKFINALDKSNRTIFGDAAAATLISNTGKAEIKDFVFGTDGKGAQNLIVRNGGMRNPYKTGKTEIDEEGTVHSDDHLYMNGAEIFNFTIDSVPNLVKKTLEKNGLEMADIDLFVFHQANKYMLDYLRRKIGISENKFFYCLEHFGNTVSSTIPIALFEADKEGRTIGNVLLAGFGVGYSWGGVILKYKRK